MWGIFNYKLFILTGILLNMTPGADTFYILGKGMSKGKKSAVISAFGITVGCLIHTILAAFGLSTILAKSITAFNIIKWAGAMYLIYLGIKSFKSSAIDVDSSENQKELSNKKIFLEGILTNILNPKVALFFISFLPQFIEADNTYGAIPFLILGITFLLTGCVWYQILALFSSTLTEKIRNNKNISKMIGKITGIAFVALGITLLQAKNSN